MISSTYDFCFNLHLYECIEYIIFIAKAIAVFFCIIKITKNWMNEYQWIWFETVSLKTSNQSHTHHINYQTFESNLHFKYWNFKHYMDVSIYFGLLRFSNCFFFPLFFGGILQHKVVHSIKFSSKFIQRVHEVCSWIDTLYFIR